MENSFKRAEPPSDIGLTSVQVKERTDVGCFNAQPQNLTPSIRKILQKNILTLFNLIHLALAALLISVGFPMNTLFLGIVLCNTALGVIQELRAKRTLDRLSILAKAKVIVVRDGGEIEIDPDDIVLDDIVRLSAGCQISADAVVTDTDGLEVDESLLTGESDSIRKKAGDAVMSGSFVTAGGAYARVTAVGSDNYATVLTIEAKKKKTAKSPLMQILNRIIKTLTFIIVPLGLLLFYSQYSDPEGTFANAILGASAAMLGMIPQGLILLTGVSLTVGAVNLARRKALVQSLFSIETLARVDVLCLDKTGTITDGTLSYEGLIPVEGFDEETATEAMKTLMSASKDTNPTATTLRKEFCANQHLSDERQMGAPKLSTLNSQLSTPSAKQTASSPPLSTLNSQRSTPFSSVRKWSGVSFDGQGSYILGAPRFVFPDTEKPASFLKVADEYAAQGFRVLCLAVSEDQLEDDRLPAGLRCIALVLLSDTVRSDAPDTFRFFSDEGVTLKVISGDDPLTVSNVAVKAGIAGADRYVDMSGYSDKTEFAHIVEENTVFGRVSPHQKRDLIKALRENGHTICMTGDGVNDILAMKESDCSIAMVGGSDAARGVCDFVLMSSAFSSMVDVLREGRRVINNIEMVSSLYLVQTIYSVLLSLLYIILPYNYPYVPLQMTPINALTVGAPTFFLALRANYAKPRGRFIANVLEVSAPAAFTVVICIVGIQLAFHYFGLTFAESSTMNVFLVGVVGFAVLCKVSRPFTLRISAMLILLAAAFVMVFVAFRDVFGLDTMFTYNALYYLLPLACMGVVMFYLLNRIMRFAMQPRQPL